MVPVGEHLVGHGATSPCLSQGTGEVVGEDPWALLDYVRPVCVPGGSHWLADTSISAAVVFDIVRILSLLSLCFVQCPQALQCLPTFVILCSPVCGFETESHCAATWLGWSCRGQQLTVVPMLSATLLCQDAVLLSLGALAWV